MEAIILAGGLGTRLRTEVNDKPKSMADISGIPFLEYQLNYLVRQGIDKLILSVGYKAGDISTYFGNSYGNIPIYYAVEETPLGTGGAVKNALKFSGQSPVLIANGDSVIGVDLNEFRRFHEERQAAVSFCLKEMKDYERYGTVRLDQDDRITGFSEKRYTKQGFINAGLYLFDKHKCRITDFPDQFSLEKGFFEKKVATEPFYGFRTKGYFRDIGIPEDYQKAKTELGIFARLDRSGTLFLDRDGVINKRIPDGYVTKPGAFEFLPQVLTALKDLRDFFKYQLIVTNQQGIGKGIFTGSDLKQVHAFMLSEIEKKGGHIDAVYVAPDLDSPANKMRKPHTGMGLKAKSDFPDIDFTRSIMVGDSVSDMQFAENLGMLPVFLGKTGNGLEKYYTISSLFQFSDLLRKLGALRIDFS